MLGHDSSSFARDPAQLYRSHPRRAVFLLARRGLRIEYRRHWRAGESWAYSGKDAGNGQETVGAGAVLCLVRAKV